jgi:hypothetical protein
MAVYSFLGLRIITLRGIHIDFHEYSNDACSISSDNACDLVSGELNGIGISIHL